MRKTGLLLCILFATSAMQMPAAAKEYKCPAHIEVTSAEIKPISGYDSWTDPQVKFYITGIDLYDGPPREMAQLKPDNADDDEAAPSTWSVAASSKGIWMVCLYSDTNARVTQKLEGHERVCTIKDIRGPEDTITAGGISLDCK